MWGWLLPRIAYGNLMVDHFVYLPGGMVGEPVALVPAPAPWVSWAVFAGWIRPGVPRRPCAWACGSRS